MVNNILRRNRRILLSLNKGGKARVNQEQLLAEGFHFGYFTSTFQNQEGARYYFCYEQGYRPLENDHYLLVVKSNLPKA
jgi:hypothetical protein